MKRIARIVVGTDFSAPAEKALDEALDLAEQLGASVTLVHSYEIPMLSMPDGVILATGIEKTLAEQGRAGLEAQLRRTQGRKIEIRTVLRVGAPWEELNAIADAENADLIVVGTHGRRGFSRIVVGSVAERMVRTATRPLLVVRADAAGAG